MALGGGIAGMRSSNTIGDRVDDTGDQGRAGQSLVAGLGSGWRPPALRHGL